MLAATSASAWATRLTDVLTMRTGKGGCRAMRSANCIAALSAWPFSTTFSTSPQSSASAEPMRSEARITACLVRAAADAMAFDGGDGDLLELLPRLTEARAEALVEQGLAQRQLAAIGALRIFQIEAGRKSFRRAGQDHHRGFEIVLELARHVAQLAHRLTAERIDVVAAIEMHDGDATLRPEALLDFDESPFHA